MFTVGITRFKSFIPQSGKKKGVVWDNLSVVLSGRWILAYFQENFPLL